MKGELSTNQQEFVRRMAEDGPELKRRGFEILQGRDDLEQYFDALSASGLFAGSEDPKPEKVARGWRFENWAALGYLKALAKKVASHPELLPLGTRVVEIIRGLETAPARSGESLRNHFSLMTAIEILAELPAGVTTRDDAAMVGRWVQETSGLEADASDWLQVLLNEPVQNAKALTLFEALIRLPRDRDGRESAYWIKELLSKRAKDIGRSLVPALDLLRVRITELVEEKSDRFASLYLRPAIEDHPQNKHRAELEGALIAGLRDGLLAWLDTDSAKGAAYVKGMFIDPNVILRRIALHCVDERFALFNDFVPEKLDGELFTLTYRHELHRLLSHHFAKLTEPTRARVLEIIRAIQDDDELHARYERARWLSACVGQGVASADQLMDETLRANPPIKVPEHPDFDLYSESWSGPGPSPYTVEEILGWSDADLLSNLMGFVEKNLWRGPTKRSLVDTLAEAIKQRPEHFLMLGPTLRQLPWAYRYAVLSAFTDLAQKDNEGTVPAPWWASAWRSLIELVEAWICDADLMRAPEDASEAVTTPTQAWIPSAVARFLEAGFKKDDRGVPQELAGRARSILERLLDVLPIDQKTDLKDALTFAINTPRGHLLEALLRMTLKEARLQEKAQGSHAAAWSRLEGKLDEQVHLAKGKNFEFSAIAGAHLPQLYWLSREWVEANIHSLIPLTAYPNNAAAFLNGLSYINVHRELYLMLNGAGLVDHLIHNLPSDEQARERFLHAVALAYIWGDEEIDGDHIGCLIQEGREQDLADFFGLFRQVFAQLDEDQKARVRVLVIHVQGLLVDGRDAPADLLSVLVGLTIFLDKLADPQADFLAKALPRLPDHSYPALSLTPELIRLLDSNPKGATAVALELARTKYFYDHNGHFKKFITALHSRGHIADALSLLEELRLHGDFRNLAAELDKRVGA